MNRLTRRVGALLLTTAVFVGGVALGTVAQSGATSEAQGTAAARLVTEEVEPSVERILRDGQGHALQKKYPDEPRDIDHVAVGPDGTVWIASTARGSDNRFLDGFQVWPVGQPGLYGSKDGVPAGISRLMFTPDGSLWAIGSGVARFDGSAWTSSSSSNKAVTPDGTLWLVTRGILESWDGESFTQHLRGHPVDGLAVDGSGTLWAVAYDTVASWDGSAWSMAQGDRGSVTMDDGSVWTATGNGVVRVQGDSRKHYLSGLNINGLAAAPDGTIWVAAERGPGNTGGLYRILPES